MRGEGLEVDSREIFSGATPSNRSNSDFGTGFEVSSGLVSDRGVSSILRDVRGASRSTNTGSLSVLSGNRIIGGVAPAASVTGDTLPNQDNHSQQPPVVVDRRVIGRAPPRLFQGDKDQQYRDTVDQRPYVDTSLKVNPT